MIVSFLYISYSFVVTRGVSGTLRDFQFVVAADTNNLKEETVMQNVPSKSYQLAVECVWGREDRQLRQISEAAELLRRTSWERNFVWKMSLHLFIGIRLVLFV